VVVQRQRKKESGKKKKAEKTMSFKTRLVRYWREEGGVRIEERGSRESQDGGGGGKKKKSCARTGYTTTSPT